MKKKHDQNKKEHKNACRRAEIIAVNNRNQKRERNKNKKPYLSLHEQYKTKFVFVYQNINPGYEDGENGYNEIDKRT